MSSRRGHSNLIPILCTCCLAILPAHANVVLLLDGNLDDGCGTADGSLDLGTEQYSASVPAISGSGYGGNQSLDLNQGTLILVGGNNGPVPAGGTVGFGSSIGDVQTVHQFTVMMWVYADTTSFAGQRHLLAKKARRMSAFNGPRWILSQFGDKVFAELREGSGAYAATVGLNPSDYLDDNFYIETSSGTFPTGQWTHVAFVYDGTCSNATLYLDGVEIISEAIPAGFAPGGMDSIDLLPDNANNLFLGGTPVGSTGGTEHFDGRIEEFHLAQRVIPESEIALYAAQSIQPDQATLCSSFTSPACVPPPEPCIVPPFDWYQTQASQRLPTNYWDAAIDNQAGYTNWMLVQGELECALASNTPLTDTALFDQHIDLDYPGLEATRTAFNGGSLAAARSNFTAFILNRFPQQTPSGSGSNVPRSENYLAGVLGPLTSSQVNYTMGPGELFDWSTFDPRGLNNYDFTAFNFWQLPIRHYLEDFASTGNTQYIGEAEFLVNGWYDAYAGQALPNVHLLSFEEGGLFRQGTLGAGAIEMTPWEHFAVAEGRLKVAVNNLLPYLSHTADPEELGMRLTMIAVEDLGLIAYRLPHYAGNFASIIGVDTYKWAVPFGFLEESTNWFNLAYGIAFTNYLTDSFPDGSTIDLSEAYLDSYLTTYYKAQTVVDEYGEQARFPLDAAAFSNEIEKTFEWLLYTSAPDLSPPTFNDCNRRPWWGIADVVVPPLEQLDWLGRDDLRWLATLRTEGTPPLHASFPFETHAESWAGVYAMRNNWSNDAVYLAVDFGPFGSAHGHPDYGSINMKAYGYDLIIDPAAGNYGQPEYNLIDTAPQTHNTIMIDGAGQWLGPTSSRPAWFSQPITTWVTNPIFDAAWGTYQFFSGLNHRRIVWFARPGYYLVVDSLPDSGVHEVRQSFQMPPHYNPVPEGNAARTHDPSRANLLVLPADNRPAPQIITGQTSPLHVGWATWSSQTARTPVPAIVYTHNATFPYGMETILFPTRQGDAANVTVNRETAQEGDTGVLVDVTAGTERDRFAVAHVPGLYTFPGAGITFEGTMAMIHEEADLITSIGLLGAEYLAVSYLTITSATPVDVELELIDGEWSVGELYGQAAVIVSQPTTSRGTPYAWLEYYGLDAGGFEAGDVTDHDGDGMQAWAEHRAGTDPANAASYLAVKDTKRMPGTSSMTITVAGRSGRQYTLRRAAGDLSNPPLMTPVTNSSVLTAHQEVDLIDENLPPDDVAVYEIEVQKP
jgi:hypothetical protein